MEEPASIYFMEIKICENVKIEIQLQLSLFCGQHFPVDRSGRQSAMENLKTNFNEATMTGQNPFNFIDFH